MGTGYKVQCWNCFDRLERLLGFGLKPLTFEDLLRRLHPSRRARVLDILKNHEVGKGRTRMAIYQFEKCGRLYNRFYVRIEYDDAQVWETIYRCPKCRRALKDMGDDFNLYRAPCPSCGQLCLDDRGFFYWD